MYWMFFNVHFYGNIIGLTLALTALLFTLLYLEKDKFYYLIFTGIFIALSIIIKTNYNMVCNVVTHTSGELDGTAMGIYKNAYITGKLSGYTKEEKTYQ